MAEESNIPFTMQLTPEKKIELATLFQQFDRDNSGFLDKKEFAKYFDRVNQMTLGVSRDHKVVFKIIDADNSGTVSFDEFMKFQEAMVEIQQKGDIKKYYKMVYDACDKGNKGWLSQKEFVKFLKYTGTKVGLFEGKKQMKEFDIDGDGKIEWNEITETIEKRAREAAEALNKQLAKLREKTQRLKRLCDEEDDW